MSETETTTEKSLAETVREKHRKFLFPSVANYYKEPIVLTEGKGLRLKDADGNLTGVFSNNAGSFFMDEVYDPAMDVAEASFTKTAKSQRIISRLC